MMEASGWLKKEEGSDEKEIVEVDNGVCVVRRYSGDCRDKNNLCLVYLNGLQ